MPRRYLHAFPDRDYAIRVRRLGAAALVLASLIALARMPRAYQPESPDFRDVDEHERIALESLARNPSRLTVSNVPLTRFEPTAPVREESAATTDGPGALPGPETGSDPPRRTLERLVLASAEQMPLIRGGLGAYYIHIVYPEEAIAAGIEGRLVLEFIVEEDGTTSDISVYAPLHPLCDSAAVQALRQTQFLPGQQGGRNVAVRMHLPVRFKLVESDSTAPDSTRTG